MAISLFDPCSSLGLNPDPHPQRVGKMMAKVLPIPAQPSLEDGDPARRTDRQDSPGLGPAPG